MANINATNRMSAEALVVKQNAVLEFIPNPKKAGRLFFTCGNITGYVSPAVNEAVLAGKIDNIAQLQYAEVSVDGNAPVPTLMMVGNSNKPALTLGTNLLH